MERDESAERFGVALRAMRERAGMTQRALAERSGFHRTYISQLERGIKSPTLAAVERISTALGTRPHLLVKAAERPRS